MNKTELLAKISKLERSANELRQLIKSTPNEKKPLDITFHVIAPAYNQLRVGGINIATLFNSEDVLPKCYIGDKRGEDASGRGRLIELYSGQCGQWFDERGKQVSGSFYYKLATD